MSKKKCVSRESGFSLVTVMVSLGLAGMVMVLVARNLSFSTRTNSKINLDQDRFQIRVSLISSLDCKASFGGFALSGRG